MHLRNLMQKTLQALPAKKNKTQGETPSHYQIEDVDFEEGFIFHNLKEELKEELEKKPEEKSEETNESEAALLFKNFPAETHVLILMMLENPADLCSVMLVSKYYYSLSQDQSVWESLFLKSEFSWLHPALSLLKMYETLDWKKTYQQAYSFLKQSKLPPFQEAPFILKEAIQENDPDKMIIGLQGLHQYQMNKGENIDSPLSFIGQEGEIEIVPMKTLAISFCFNSQIAAFLISQHFTLDNILYTEEQVDEELKKEEEPYSKQQANEKNEKAKKEAKTALTRASLILLCCDDTTLKILLAVSQKMQKENHPLLELGKIKKEDRIKQVEKILSVSDDNTLLHHLAEMDTQTSASCFNREELNFYIKILIKNGVNPDQENKNKVPPISIAILKENFLIVKVLLAQGANIIFKHTHAPSNMADLLDIYHKHKTILKSMEKPKSSFTLFKKEITLEPLEPYLYTFHPEVKFTCVDLLSNDLSNPKIDMQHKTKIVDFLINDDKPLDLAHYRRIIKLAHQGIFKLPLKTMSTLLQLYIDAVEHELPANTIGRQTMFREIAEINSSILEESIKRTKAIVANISHQTNSNKNEQKEVFTFDQFASEIHLLMFMMLDPKDLCSVMLVSKYYHSLTQDQAIWKNLFARHKKLGWLFNALLLLEEYKTINWHAEYKQACENLKESKTSKIVDTHFVLQQAIFANEEIKMMIAMQRLELQSDLVEEGDSAAEVLTRLLNMQLNKSNLSEEYNADLQQSINLQATITNSIKIIKNTQSLTQMIPGNILAISTCSSEKMAAVLITKKFTLDNILYPEEAINEKNTSALIRTGLILLLCDNNILSMLVKASQRMQKEKHPLLALESAKTKKDKMKKLENILAIKNNDTLLHYLTETSKYFDDGELRFYIKRLINNGINLDQKNKAGDAPLDLAIKNGHLPMARALLENGAKVKKEYQVQKDSPLHYLIKIYLDHETLLEEIDAIHFFKKIPIIGKKTLTFFEDNNQPLLTIINSYLGLSRGRLQMSDGLNLLINDLCNPKISDACKTILIDFIMSASELNHSFCRRIARLAYQGNFFKLPDDKMKQLLVLNIEKVKDLFSNNDNLKENDKEYLKTAFKEAEDMLADYEPKLIRTTFP